MILAFNDSFRERSLVHEVDVGVGWDRGRVVELSWVNLGIGWGGIVNVGCMGIVIGVSLG